MNLSEKVKGLLEARQSRETLVGTKVKLPVNGEIVNGNFRQFQTNGLANIYLDKSYINNKGKLTRWIKISAHLVELI